MIICILSKAAAQLTNEGAGGLKGCFCSVDDLMEILLGRFVAIDLSRWEVSTFISDLLFKSSTDSYNLQ